MRIRRKPWARPELAACPFAIGDPQSRRGRWSAEYKNPKAPLHIELGCGKGMFIAQKAFENADINYLAVDLKSEVLGLAKRNAESVYAQGGREVDNLLLTAFDIERLGRIIDKNDCVKKIYINFCNPWPKTRDFKHRLTHPRQLEIYKQFLLPGHMLLFKTDDDSLFAATGQYLAQSGFEITEHIDDLPASHEESAIMTEHEQMFRSMGLPIHYIAAMLKEGDI